jgi:hypothetical protein
MSGVGFTLIALVLSIAGSLVLWLRHRKPTTLDRGIVDFQREMRALSPDMNRHDAGHVRDHDDYARREGTG